MTKDGLPIKLFELPERIDTGIESGALEGVVADYDAREAARFSGYSWNEWLKIHYMERAQAVAYYRLHYRIEAFVQKATEAKYNQRRNRN